MDVSWRIAAVGKKVMVARAGGARASRSHLFLIVLTIGELISVIVAIMSTTTRRTALSSL
jgi:hypothetical protein